ITMAKYVMEQRTEKSKEMVSLKQQFKDQQQKLEFVHRKMGELSSGSSREERDAIIVIDRDNGGGGKVRLNYLVDRVTWAPQYKLRAGKVTENVQIDYLASLVQQSGEDWNGIDLTLSTAQPMLNAAPPDLQKLEISVMPRASLPAGGPGAPGHGGAGGFGGGSFNPGYKAADLTQNAMALRTQAQEAANSSKSK